MSLLHIEEPQKSPLSAPSWRAFLELGFRPLYLAGCSWAAISVAWWVFAPAHIPSALPAVLWHAHEMLWGFVGTVAVGFLLTAGHNWTGITPLKGWPLGLLAAVWLAARLALLVPASQAALASAVLDFGFFAVGAAALGRSVWLARNGRNAGLPLMLLGLGLTHVGFMAHAFEGEYEQAMRLYHAGLWCMGAVTLLIARRVIPFFASRAVAGLNIPMLTGSGLWQLGATLLAVAFTLLGWTQEAALGLALAGAMALWQLMRWQPWAVRHVPLLWVLYVGYGALGVGLLVAAAHSWGWIERAVWGVHAVGVGGFAVLIIGMVTRTSLGHTGRALRANRPTVVAYSCVIAAAMARLGALAAAQWLPVATIGLLHLSATLWVLGFGIFVAHYGPMLVRERADAQRGVPVSLRTPAR